MATQMVQIMKQFGPMAAFEETVDIKPSDMKLIQPVNSTDDAKAGMFLDVSTNIARPEIRLVPLLFHTGRLYFEGAYSSDNDQPVCRSRDGKLPVIGEGLTPKAISCETCMLSKWPARGKPPCAATVTMLFIDRQTDLTYWMLFKRSHYQVGKDLMDAYVKLIKQAAARGKELYTFQMEVKMTAIKARTFNQFIPRFGAIMMTSADNDTIAKYAKMYEQAVTRKLTADKPTPEPVVKPKQKRSTKKCPKKSRS